MATEERKSTVWEYTEMNRKLRKANCTHGKYKAKIEKFRKVIKFTLLKSNHYITYLPY